MMHKGHTGFYTGPEGSTWFDFQKGVGWFCDYPNYASSMYYSTLWGLEEEDLQGTTLALPEEYLK